MSGCGILGSLALITLMNYWSVSGISVPVRKGSIKKVKEIFALSVDYDSKSQIAQNFFKSVQKQAGICRHRPHRAGTHC